MSPISCGSSRAIRSVGSSLISSSDARSIRRTSHALASSSRESASRPSGPRMGVIRLPSVFTLQVRGGQTILSPETADPTRNLRKSHPSAGYIPGVAELISIAEARRRVLASVRPLGSEEVALAGALGRVLAEDVRSPIDVPPFDSSAMDGYAVVAGPPAELEVVAEARAGHPAEVAVRPGAAIAVSTGAAVPEGATAVVPVERTRTDGAGRVLVPETEPGANVRRAGEDVSAGEVVLAGGVVLGPAELGVAASIGRGALHCAVRPRVALLVTGDELAAPGEPLRPGQIYSSNDVALAAQLERVGADLVHREDVRDTAESTRAAIETALAAADVVVVSGGVSVGPHDHVKDALRGHGVEERFWGVSLRPGKPTWFGTRAGTLAFGLP